MKGKFITGLEAERDRLDWGTMGWFSRPATTSAKDLVVIEVDLQPGFGHNFHKHPHQEEVIYVVQGSVEQWVEQESQHLNAGDGVFIGADVVHASFNVSDAPAKLIAILGPCIGDEGYELVEVFDQEPWASLR
jgi:quercetin dioxygenase-like cupin family protein